MIHLLTAIRLTPGGSSAVHIYTQTIHRTKKKKYTEQHKNKFFLTVLVEYNRRHHFRHSY
jgi:hypothetical protein